MAATSIAQKDYGGHEYCSKGSLNVSNLPHFLPSIAVGISAKMFFFQSSPSTPSVKIERSHSSSTYSIGSSVSVKTEDSIEKEPSTIDITPCSSVESLAPKGLHKGARQRLRCLWGHKSPKAIPSTPKEIAFSYAVVPTLILPILDAHSAVNNQQRAKETALIINYNSTRSHIQHTLESALQTFPKENIFVVGNGNSDRAVNNTSVTCAWFGVRHYWISTRSKVAAQYVGVAAAHRFRYCMLIDEDIALPADFPVYTNRIETRHASEYNDWAPIRAVAYAVDSQDDEDSQTGGSWEFGLSSLPETFFDKSGETGTASFPHGEVSLWDRRLLEECFHRHPGYKNSPNWFLGINLALVLQRKDS